MLKFVARIALFLSLGLSLAGCDKCGDWFWIDTATPHSCKEAPPPR